jgi:hypothetical protein
MSKVRSKSIKWGVKQAEKCFLWAHVNDPVLPGKDPSDEARPCSYQKEGRVWISLNILQRLNLFLADISYQTVERRQRWSRALDAPRPFPDHGLFAGALLLASNN